MDAMEDLGNLPYKVKTVRNRRTGVEFHQADCEFPDWENHVRWAYNHQDEMEMVLDGKLDVEALGGQRNEGATGAVSAEGLRTLHWKKLQAQARALNVATTGTKEQIIERILAASAVSA